MMEGMARSEREVDKDGQQIDGERSRRRLEKDNKERESADCELRTTNRGKNM